MMKKYLLIVFTIFCLLNISCEKGEVGPTGEKGETGLTGSKGDKGDTGATGEAGQDGSDGTDGVDGVDGAKGDTGATGPQGEKGDKGDKGNTGATGAQGEQGEQGDKGDTGATGPQGEKGDKGEPGSAGALSFTYLKYSFANAQITGGSVENSNLYRMEAVVQLKPSNYSSLAEKGLVLVYIRDPDNAEGIWNLQYLEGLQYAVNSGMDQTDLLSFYGYAAKNYVKIVSACAGFDDTNRLVNIIKTKKIDIKIVVIPQINLSAIKSEGLNLKNFSAVASRFHVN